jgi:hypothetical protein
VLWQRTRTRRKQREGGGGRAPCRHLRSSLLQVRALLSSTTQHSLGRSLQPSGKATPGEQQTSLLLYTL